MKFAFGLRSLRAGAYWAATFGLVGLVSSSSASLVHTGLISAKDHVSARVAVGGSFSFTLNKSATTSAGIYNSDDQLVRTLWGNRSLAAGSYRESWDGLDDHGAPAPDDSYSVKVLMHNVAVKWDGVIGNSSSELTGTKKFTGLGAIIDMLNIDDRMYVLRGYQESGEQVDSFARSDPGHFTRHGESAYPANAYVASAFATDGKYIYQAETQNGYFGDNGNTFIVAYDPKAGDSTRVFTGLTSVPGTSAGQNNGGKWIIVGQGSYSSNTISSLAVQKNGRLIAAAQRGLGLIRFFDKYTGLPASVPSLIAIGIKDVRWDPTDQTVWASSGRALRSWRLMGNVWIPGRTITESGTIKSFAINPSNGQIALSVGDFVQQLRIYTPAGQLRTIIGEKGGTSNSISTSNNRMAVGGGIGYEPDGRLWAVDWSNSRVARFSPNGQYETEIRWVCGYSCTVDKNDPSRIFSGFMEFQRDWSRPLTGGLNGGWKLIRNWNTKGYTSNTLTPGLTHVVTAANGRTYAIMQTAQTGVALVELASDGIRYIRPWNYVDLRKDMSAWERVNSNGYQIIKRTPLLGFSGADPVWGRASEYCRLPMGSDNPVMTIPTPAGYPMELLPDGSLVTLNAGGWRAEGLYTVGFTPAGGQDFSVKAAQTSFSTPMMHDCHMPAMPGTGSFQAASNVRAVGDVVAVFAQGEFFDNGQANQILFFHACGLPLAQFGNRSFNGAPFAATSGKSGNFISNAMVGLPDGTLRIIHCDESTHAGLHELSVSNLSSIQVVTMQLNTGISSVHDVLAPTQPATVSNITFADTFLRSVKGSPGNGWTDNAAAFSIVNNRLKVGGVYNADFSAFLARSDAKQDILQKVDVPQQLWDNTKMRVNYDVLGTWGLMSRLQGDGSRYFAKLSATRYLGNSDNGTLQLEIGCFIGSKKYTLAIDRATNLPAAPGHAYSLRFETSGKNMTHLKAVVYDTTSGVEYMRLECDNDEPTLQTAGRYGIMGGMANNEFTNYQAGN